MTNNLTTNKKSIEQRLIPFIYDRVYSINKGILRILILIIYGLEIVMIAFNSDNFKVVQIPIWIFIVILYYFIFWTLVRIALWIYDGFKKE
jgi:uncharacterized RDD family membrane protein YckC